MDFQELFPIWDKLTPEHQQRLTATVASRKVSKGTLIHNGSMDCLGLLLVRSGQLRAYILSEDGREVTLYRLFERDICLLSAACVMQSIQFEIFISAEKDTDFFIIPPMVFKQIMAESAVVANYTNELMATRFSEVMWLVEQIMWKSIDKRLATFLLEESALENSPVLKLTHEIISSHLGTAREVVTRMLRYFQSEGYVKLSRGTVEITDREGMEVLADI